MVETAVSWLLQPTEILWLAKSAVVFLLTAEEFEGKKKQSQKSTEMQHIWAYIYIRTMYEFMILKTEILSLASIHTGVYIEVCMCKH